MLSRYSILVVVVVLAVLICLLMATRTRAHMPDRPDLNAWASHLQNGIGSPCCDGFDAVPITDPDWDATPDGHYRVMVEGEWYQVPEASVVQGPNKYGRALLWGYWISPGGMVNQSRNPSSLTFAVRCFMPGAGL